MYIIYKLYAIYMIILYIYTHTIIYSFYCMKMTRINFKLCRDVMKKNPHATGN